MSDVEYDEFEEIYEGYLIRYTIHTLHSTKHYHFEVVDSSHGGLFGGANDISLELARATAKHEIDYLIKITKSEG